MIRLSGHSVEEIGIEFTGLRPGEKLEEELLSDHERTTATPHPKLRVAIAAEPPAALLDRFRDGIEACNRDSEDSVHALLEDLVPEFQRHSGQAWEMQTEGRSTAVGLKSAAG
jgi:FlaA1/EpsC-like NDP-sugar epimerase